MREDFYHAGRRHWRDASVLAGHDPPRLDNADQLLGLAVECLLKALLLEVTHRPAADIGRGGALARYRGHVALLWPELALYLDGRCLGQLAGLLGSENPFCDFDVAQRYGPDGVGAQGFVRHRDGAARVLRALDAARLSGELELRR
jgi:hypothetical protein